VQAAENGPDAARARRLTQLTGKILSSPVETIAELKTFSDGLVYLLEQVELLEDQLAFSQFLHPGERVLAIHLSGGRPSDLFVDLSVMQGNLRSPSAIHGPGRISAADAAQIFMHARPQNLGLEEYARRLGEWLGELVDVAEGRACLEESVAALKKVLRELLLAVLEQEQV